MAKNLFCDCLRVLQYHNTILLKKHQLLGFALQINQYCKKRKSIELYLFFKKLFRITNVKTSIKTLVSAQLGTPRNTFHTQMTDIASGTYVYMQDICQCIKNMINQQQVQQIQIFFNMCIMLCRICISIQKLNLHHHQYGLPIRS